MRSRFRAQLAIGPLWMCLSLIGTTQGCGSSEKQTSVLPASALDGRVVPIDLTGAATRLPGQIAAELPAADERGLSYRVFEIAGQAGEVLSARMESSLLSCTLLLGRPHGTDLEILDSQRERTVASVSLELPTEGTYLVVAASNSPEGGPFTLDVNLRPHPTLDISGEEGASYALLASIENYPRERVDLQGPHHDSELMRAVLVDSLGFDPAHVVVLRDETVTRKNLIDAWLTLLRQAGPDGLAVFYFSGHGIQVEQSPDATSPEADGRDEALLLADGSVLVDHELGTLADGLRAGRKLLILDNCYAGTGSRARGGAVKRALAERLDFPLRIPSRTLGDGVSKSIDSERGQPHLLLAAAGEDEVAWISDDAPRADARPPVSVFTCYLVDELAALSPEATFDELMANVHQRTLAFVRRQFGDNQTPHLEGTAGDLTVRAFLSPSSVPSHPE